MYLKNKL